MKRDRDAEIQPAPQAADAPPAEWELPGASRGRRPTPEDGEYERRTALLLAIVGLIYLPIFFGPLAVFHARRAERIGFPAPRVVMLGWIETVLGILQVGLFVAFVLFMETIMSWVTGLRMF